MSEFEDKESHLIGKAATKDRIVRLNASHPYVAVAKCDRDANRLFLIAMALWSDAWIKTDEKGQKRLDGMERMSFTDKLSAMLKVESQEAVG